MVLIWRLAIPALVRFLVRFPEFQLIQPILHFIDPQKHPPVLTQELPPKPAARGKDEPHQHKGPMEQAAHNSEMRWPAAEEGEGFNILTALAYRERTATGTTVEAQLPTDGATRVLL